MAGHNHGAMAEDAAMEKYYRETSPPRRPFRACEHCDGLYLSPSPFTLQIYINDHLLTDGSYGADMT